MKRRGIFILLGFVAVLGPIAYALLSAPRDPVALFFVRDTAGKPVSGAIVKPYALRPKKGGADYFWSDRITVKPVPVTTDANGCARVAYPRFIFEQLETGEITVAVNHPDFCSGGFPRTVAFAPPANASLREQLAYPFLLAARRVPARPDPIVLKRGGVLRVMGYLETPAQPLANLHPQAVSIEYPESDYWTNRGDGWMTTRRVAEGAGIVRLAYLPEKGKCWFSDAVSFQAAPGQTNEFQLQLKPGLRLTGSLAAPTPRPVKNGIVQLTVFPTNGATGGEQIRWESARPINADGSFTFESLPPGKLEVIAICDGWVSSDPATNRSGGIRRPQPFLLDADHHEIELAMEPTATALITVLDDHGAPLPGATVDFWPNVIWGAWSSTVFASDRYETEDVARSGVMPDWQKLRQAAKPRFEGKTDPRGVAVVSNLLDFGTPEPFAVSHDAYEMPIIRTNGNQERYAWVLLRHGETNPTTVTMQKKGTQIMRPNK